MLNSLPWVTIGDFNEILSYSEKEGGSQRRQSLIDNFRSTINDCLLFDIGFIGPRFTWNNRRRISSIKERMDWGLATQSWFDLFPSAHVYHLSSTHSDHLPLLLTQHVIIKGKTLKAKVLPRFDPFWLHDGDCEHIFRLHWKPCLPLTATSLMNRITSTRTAMKSWSKEKHGNLGLKISQIQADLFKLRCQQDFSVSQELDLISQLEELLSMEDSYWKQRSRSEWLKFGDRNTSYFHHKASQRKERNAISFLVNEHDVQLNDLHSMHDHANSFFAKLFSTSFPETSGIASLLFAN